MNEHTLSRHARHRRCPCCGSDCTKAASIHMAETWFFNRTGVARPGFLDSVEVDLDVRGGTARGLAFEEPKPQAPNYLPAIAAFTAVALGATMLVKMPFLLEFITGGVVSSNMPVPQPGQPITNLEQLAGLVQSLIPLCVAVILISAVFSLVAQVKKADRDADEANRKAVHMARRWNDIWYCEKDNMLFDDRGNQSIGNQDGFRTILSVGYHSVDGEMHAAR